jgi:hypothetical protein
MILKHRKDEDKFLRCHRELNSKISSENLIEFKKEDKISSEEANHHSSSLCARKKNNFKISVGKIVYNTARCKEILLPFNVLKFNLILQTL